MKIIAPIIDLSNRVIDDIDKIISLYDLDFIEDLDISDTNITDLDFLEQMINLKTLDISGTMIKDISVLENLSKLEVLIAHDAPIKYLWPLKNLINLKELRMERCSIISIHCLAKLKNLEYLNLYDNENIDTIDALSDLQKLKELCIKGTGIIYPEQLNVLCKLNNLKILSVHYELEFMVDYIINHN